MAKLVTLPSVALIVARSHPGHVIGVQDKLPWRLKSDLKRFKAITTGHAIVMGSKTFASIGHPLPNRTNIVLSRRFGTPESQIRADDKTLWASNRAAAMYLADLVSIAEGNDRFFIIGGSQIYTEFMENDLVDKVYITEVDAPHMAGDSFFPHIFGKDKWDLVEEADFAAGADDEYGSRFAVYQKRGKHRRRQPITSFLTAPYSSNAWVGAYLSSHESALKQRDNEN